MMRKGEGVSAEAGFKDVDEKQRESRIVNLGMTDNCGNGDNSFTH